MKKNNLISNIFFLLSDFIQPPTKEAAFQSPRLHSSLLIQRFLPPTRHH